MNAETQNSIEQPTENLSGVCAPPSPPAAGTPADLPADPRWWIPWVALAALGLVALAIPATHTDVAKVRRQMEAQRCREQMLALAEGEVQHYLDHQSFTTEQRALTRYVPFAEHAQCPSCRTNYRLEVFQNHVCVRCPCESVRHGWVERPAPAGTDSGGPERHSSPSQ
ncbi:hypothetical protein JXA88_02380 [Candidatus Fermentibacteria bacterium]|nr:hypothetical protein [Candidatus Fermentibacteria bacterium]